MQLSTKTQNYWTVQLDIAMSIAPMVRTHNAVHNHTHMGLLPQGDCVLYLPVCRDEFSVEMMVSCLLEFYILTTSMVLSGWILTCDSAH